MPHSRAGPMILRAGSRQRSETSKRTWSFPLAVQPWAATAVAAHGCTAKGNDQVRFDVSLRCLDPALKIMGPAREWGMNREQILDYCTARGIDVPLSKKNPFSIDENLWGR